MLPLDENQKSLKSKIRNSWMNASSEGIFSPNI